MLAAVLMISLSSCGSSNDYDAINERIDAGDVLTQEDYSMMIQYLEVPLTKSVEVINKATQTDNLDTRKLEDELKEVSDKYPYAQKFTQYLYEHVHQLSPENMKEFQALSEKLYNNIN